jgi:hypothetical protein
MMETRGVQATRGYFGRYVFDWCVILSIFCYDPSVTLDQLASWHFAAARSGTISQISPLQISPGKLRHRFASILAVKEEAHIAHKRTHDCTHVAYSIHSGSTSSSARVQDASATTIQM